MANIPCKLFYHHTGIFVKDMDKSISWYEEILGFKKMFENVFPLGPGQGDTRMCWLKNGDCYIELYEHNPARAPFSMENYIGELGVKHICLYVKNGELEGLTKYFEEKGCTFMVKDFRWPKEICGKPEGCGVVYIFDPDGIPVEIQEEYTPGEY